MPQPDPGPTSMQLLQRASEGDQASLGLVYERFRPALLTRIRTMMGAEARRVAESGDFLQGVFAAVLSDLKGRDLDDEGLLRWMTAVARNDIRDSARRRHEQGFDSLSTMLAGRGSSATPASRVDRKERLDQLAMAMESLPDQLRRVLELRVFEEARFREVGERLGCSDEHARYLFNKALIEVGRAISADR